MPLYLRIGRSSQAQIGTYLTFVIDRVEKRPHLVRRPSFRVRFRALLRRGLLWRSSGLSGIRFDVFFLFGGGDWDFGHVGRGEEVE